MGHRTSLWISVLAVTLASAAGAVAAPAAPVEARPPVAQRRPFEVLSPHGARRDDWYWLRDDSRQSADVLGYLAAENRYRDAYMAPSHALEDALFREIVGRLQPNEASVPVADKGFLYYTRYRPGTDYPVYARRRAPNGREQVMLDGNVAAKGRAFFQVGATAVSPDGRWLAYTVDTVGRRQYTLRIKDLETGRVLADRVANVEAEMVWAADNRTILYVEKDPVTLLSVRLHAHRVGSPASADPVLYEERDHSYYLSVATSRSEKYLFIELVSTDQTEVLYADAADPRLRFQAVIPREHGHRYDVEQVGDDFVIRTNWQAPNYRIVRAPIATAADKSTWRDVVAAREDVLLEDFEVSRDHLAVNERVGGLLKVRVLPWSGGAGVALPADQPTYVMSLVHTPGFDSPVVRYAYSSLASPRRTYDLDMTSTRATLLKTEAVRGGFDATRYTTEFLMIPARDGRQVPVSLVHRKDVRLDGTAPLYQYAYGSYGASSDPDFVSSWVSLLDRGFIVAIAHVRGGQELGRAWYEDGRQLHKRNTFTDFIDATEYLVAHRYAARDQVFAMGGSAGGLLMGAISNLAPEDYRGIIAYVPFVDVITTMLDDSIPLTSNEYDEWGNPSRREVYDYMLTYSPYDNVTAREYPAMLVTTSLWDSQVQYFEPAKWVAKLRATKTDRNPLVFSINMAGGHGGRSGRYQGQRETALEYAFILRQLGIYK